MKVVDFVLALALGGGILYGAYLLFMWLPPAVFYIAMGFLVVALAINRIFFGRQGYAMGWEYLYIFTPPFIFVALCVALNWFGLLDWAKTTW